MNTILLILNVPNFHFSTPSVTVVSAASTLSSCSLPPSPETTNTTCPLSIVGKCLLLVRSFTAEAHSWAIWVPVSTDLSSGLSYLLPRIHSHAAELLSRGWGKGTMNMQILIPLSEYQLLSFRYVPQIFSFQIFFEVTHSVHWPNHISVFFTILSLFYHLLNLNSLPTKKNNKYPPKTFNF